MKKLDLKKYLYNGKYPDSVCVTGPTQRKETGKGCIIGIIDDGIFHHEDLKNNYLGKQTNFSTSVGGSDHGTHVAGIICANGNILGVAKNAKFKSYKVSSATEMALAINQAVKDGCHIINISMSTGRDVKCLEDSIDDAWDNNVLVIAAGGNQSGNYARYPAHYDKVIGVGAVDYDVKSGKFKRALFSNCTKEISCCSDGVNVLSTIGKKQYQFKTGTSFAAPHVTGACALIWEEMNKSGRVQVSKLRKETLSFAKDIFIKGRDDCSGVGFITFFNKMPVVK